MTGIILDCVLMLLLVVALAYGVRLEKKLTALRAGQLAFAGAVTELNTAAGRAESALASLRASGEEADILHDRLIKAREVKTQLEMLIARAPSMPAPVSREARVIEPVSAPVVERALAPAPTADDERALRMAALAERIGGIAAPKGRPLPTRIAPGRENVSAILSAMTANQAAQQSLNRARRNLDEDLFAA